MALVKYKEPCIPTLSLMGGKNIFRSKPKVSKGDLLHEEHLAKKTGLQHSDDTVESYFYKKET